MMPKEVQTEPTKWASRGDTIETTLSTGDVLTASLDTPEACAFGNELIASGRWKLQKKTTKGES